MGMTFAYVGEESIGLTLVDRLGVAGFELADRDKADVIFSFYADQSDLEDAYFDSEGLIQLARKGAYLLDLSPSTPGFARELYAVAIVNDLHAIEAPLAVRDCAVSDAYGDPQNLVCFLAAEDDEAATVMPLLSAIAGTVERTGGAGTAQLARGVVTLIRAAQLVSAMESDALCRVCVHADDHRRLLELPAVASFVPDAVKSLYAAVAERRFSGSYTVEICMAELMAALTAADDADLILPGAEAAQHLFELLAVIGGSNMSSAALSLAYCDDEICARYGLDWSRAEQLYIGDFENDEDFDDFEDYPFEDYESYDDASEDIPPHYRSGGFRGGFGGYSEN